MASVDLSYDLVIINSALVDYIIGRIRQWYRVIDVVFQMVLSFVILVEIGNMWFILWVNIGNNEISTASVGLFVFVLQFLNPQLLDLKHAFCEEITLTTNIILKFLNHTALDLFVCFQNFFIILVNKFTRIQFWSSL